MKKIIFLLFLALLLLPTLASSQDKYPTILVDTVMFTRDSNATVYASGDVMASYLSASKYFVFSNIAKATYSRGRIVNVAVMADTANETTASVKVRFFSVTDTTGLWAAIAADNAVFQSKFAIGTGYFTPIGDVAVTLAMFGTTGGGATSAQGFATAALDYVLPNGKLYCIVLATAAYTPKAAGKIRVIVTVERQY